MSIYGAFHIKFFNLFILSKQIKIMDLRCGNCNLVTKNVRGDPDRVKSYWLCMCGSDIYRVINPIVL